MPVIVVDDIAFTPQEARDAILLRDFLAGVANDAVDGFALPPLEGMSDTTAMYWLVTAVTNAKAQRRSHGKDKE